MAIYRRYPSTYPANRIKRKTTVIIFKLLNKSYCRSQINWPPIWERSIKFSFNHLNEWLPVQKRSKTGSHKFKTIKTIKLAGLYKNCHRSSCFKNIYRVKRIALPLQNLKISSVCRISRDKSKENWHIFRTKASRNIQPLIIWIAKMKTRSVSLKKLHQLPIRLKLCWKLWIKLKG